MRVRSLFIADSYTTSGRVDGEGGRRVERAEPRAGWAGVIIFASRPVAFASRKEICPLFPLPSSVKQRLCGNGRSQDEDVVLLLQLDDECMELLPSLVDVVLT